MQTYTSTAARAKKKAAVHKLAPESQTHARVGCDGSATPSATPFCGASKSSST
jgi:hypothetical protein